MLKTEQTVQTLIDFVNQVWEQVCCEMKRSQQYLSWDEEYKSTILKETTDTSSNGWFV